MKKITLLLLLMSVFAVNGKDAIKSNFLECPAPMELAVSNITLTGATFSWSVGGGETAWEIVVQEAGANAPTAETAGIEVTGDPIFTITNLVSCQYYDVYVRANCGSEFSVWTQALNFTTASEATATFNETLETTANLGMPSCWSKIVDVSNPSSTATIRTVNFNAYEGTNAIIMNNHGAGDGSAIILISPNLSTLTTGTHRLKLYAKSFADNSIEIGTVDVALNEFHYLETIAITAEYTEYILDFSDYTGTETHIGIRHSGTENSSILLDNLVWEASPLCPDITDLVVDDTATNSVTLSWTSNGDETAWDIVYGATSVTDPTTLTPITPAAAVNTGAVVEGLTANTSYNLWVRSVCAGDADGYWIGPVTFNTACLPITSFNENFDSTIDNALPACWMQILSGETVSETSYASIYEGLAHSGDKCVRINNTDSGLEANVMLVSPNLSNLSNATHRLRFFAFGDGASVQVGTLDNNTESGTFTSLIPITLTSQYAEYIVDFSAYDGEDHYVAIRNASVNDYTSAFIDDLIWEVIPACSDVTGINITDITTTEATVNWTEGNGETTWQVAYGVNTVTTPATATISELLSDTNFSLEGLTASTNYKVWVRSVCGSTNGTWIGPIAFGTGCNETTTFSENFDSVSFPNIPLCWNEIISGAANDSDISVSPYSASSAPNSLQLYGGYSGSSSTIILVSPPVSNLAAGTHQLKFKGTGGTPLEIGTLNGTTSDATFTPLSTITLSDFSIQSFTVSFAAYTGTDTHIGFRLKTNGENSYASIDDAVWEQALSSGSFDTTQFSYYPNPVKDVLNLSYNENITNIAVYNLLGQKVMENNPNSTSVKLDMSALSSGSYIVKVASNDQIKSIKVIKQ